jgi:hypothetical protein
MKEDADDGVVKRLIKGVAPVDWVVLDHFPVHAVSG